MATSTVTHTGIHNQKKKKKGKSVILAVSLLANLLSGITLLYIYPLYWQQRSNATNRISTELTFHGGNPEDVMKGTCFCSRQDTYCMCNPSLCIDLVIASGADELWVVRRKDTHQLATMGGFVNVGETVEQAVARELREEMGLELLPHQMPKLFGVYSDPKRDNRRHTTSVAFAVHLDGTESPVAKDDVKEVEKIKWSEIEDKNFFSDHKTLLLDYREIFQKRNTVNADSFSKRPPPQDFSRSVCLPLP